MVLGTSACASLVSSAAAGLTDSLAGAILNQNDPQTVRDGAPSYLLLIDGLIQGEPGNERLLRTGARLYSAYASAFVEDEARAKKMTSRARDYGLAALCLRLPALCAAVDRPYDEYAAALDQIGKDDVPVVYAFAATWVGWIQAHRGDWNAVADLAKVKASMQKVLELDEGYERGGAHFYMGLLETLVPRALGGNPEAGKKHFERAIQLSEGKDLMVKVQYAERYARLVFDRGLHDRLLKEVMESPADEPGFTLLNTLAKERARQLLASADQYF